MTSVSIRQGSRENKFIQEPDPVIKTAAKKRSREQDVTNAIKLLRGRGDTYRERQRSDNARHGHSRRSPPRQRQAAAAGPARERAGNERKTSGGAERSRSAQTRSAATRAAGQTQPASTECASSGLAERSGYFGSAARPREVCSVFI